MFLDILKEKYKNTFIEPRLSGKYLPEDFLNNFIQKVDDSSTLDEFLQVINEIFGHQNKNLERHIIARIIAWENEPPFIEQETK